MSLNQPPYTYGIMSFVYEFQADGITANPNYDATRVSIVTSKLNAIISAFVPNDYQLSVDTFYITATYNQQNPTEPINGDTCSYLLAPQPQQGV